MFVICLLRPISHAKLSILPSSQKRGNFFLLCFIELPNYHKLFLKLASQLILEMNSDSAKSDFYHCSLNLCDLWSSDTFSNLINRMIDVSDLKICWNFESDIKHYQVPVVVHDSSLGISTKIRRIGKGEIASDDWQIDKAGFTCIILLSDEMEGEQSVEVQLKQGDGQIMTTNFPVGGQGYAMLIQSSCVPYRIQSVHDCYGIIVHLEPADGWADEENGTPSYDSTLDVDDLPSSLEDGMLSPEDNFDLLDDVVPNAFLPGMKKGARSRSCSRFEEEMFMMELDG